MNRFAPFAAKKPRPILGVVVALLVPLITAGILIGVLAKPQDRLDQITAAIVNNDEPVELEGQLVPLGRQLAGGLVESSEATKDRPAGYQWEITDPEKAATGLKDGTFGAVVTIPENFSAAATSTAGDIADVEQATIAVTTSPHARLIDEALTQAIATTATDVLGTELTRTYLENLFIGFNTLNSELGTAADGAGEIAAGAGELTDGVGELSEGTSELAGGADQLADGTRELVGGIGEFNNGILQLSSGTGALAGGARDLADGAKELAGGLGELDGGLGELATGGDDLAAGLAALQAGTSDMPDQFAPLIEGVGGLEDGAGALAAGLEQQEEGLAGLRDLACSPLVEDASGELCAGLEALAAGSPELIAGAEGLESGAGELKAGAGELVSDSGPLAELQDGIAALADGSSELAKGLNQVHGAAGEVTAGAGELATGADDLAGGAAGVATGVSALETGAGDLGVGASQLSGGADELAGGVHQLDEGVGELADGTEQLGTGTQELAEGLDEAVDQIPTFPDEYRDSAAEVIANPVAVAGGEDASAFDLNLTRNWIGFFTVIALWISALWIYPAAPTTTAHVRGTTRSSAAVTLRSLALPAAVAVAQGLIVTALVALTGNLSGGKLVGFAALSVLVAVTFLFVQRALMAIGGRIGLVASLAVAILAIATALTSAMPALARTVITWLPIGPAADALNGLENGLSIGGSVVALAVWALAGWVVTALTVRKQRVAQLATT